MNHVLAVDLGGSGLKATLFDDTGRSLASARGAITFSEERDGWSEADPESWWSTLLAVTEQIAADSRLDTGDVAIVAICGFTRTQVFLDRAGNSVRPAIGFRDRRAAHHADTIQRLADPALDRRQLNGFHPLARLMWLKEHEPENWSRVERVLEPKDYLNLRLTGEVRSDEVSLHAMLTTLSGGGESLAARCGIDRQILPGLGNPLDIVGTVRAGLPGAASKLAGAKVMLGSNDTWTAVAGMDALLAGRAYCVSGSSEVLGLLAPAEAHAPGLVTVRWGDALWHLGGPGQNGANTLDWARMTLGATDGVEAPDSMPPALVFLPFLLGERTPFWDGDLRGAVLGLDGSTTRQDIARALMAGIAFVNRTVLERAEAASGLRAQEIRIGGGGSRNAQWNRIRASVLGRPVLASPADETGLAGCLAAARVALGMDTDLSTAARMALAPFERFEPDPLHSERYQELYAVFLEAHEAVSPLSRRLASIRSTPAKG